MRSVYEENFVAQKITLYISVRNGKIDFCEALLSFRG